MTWAKTVAMAAPATPMEGTGPAPKMSRGSRIKLMSRPRVVTRKVVTVLPMAVRMPPSTWSRKEKTTRPLVIIR